MKRGLFITFEGGEGSGKTTQIRKIARWLKKERYLVLMTREPGGTKFADWIRKIVLDKKNKGIDPLIELFLYEVARCDHIIRRIVPYLRKGGIVLCDRFTDATVAYQGYGRRLPLPLVKRLNQFVCQKTSPDKTFLFRLPLEVGMKRMRSRRGRMNRLDRESRNFHKRVERGYLALACKEKGRFQFVDASQSPQEVFRSLQGELRWILP
ncbi:MAG: dTMP kinase [Deltaproteobacteria bacterium]|nr:dTMP kinase [Deltaproteobacteria bacterium]